MMIKRKFKKGAASFYIVAFSTLILVIIAASFATVIVSEVTRASNDDLSQSAYDAALAGIEDAKLAYSNYRRCLAKWSGELPTIWSSDSNVTCQDIIYWMNHPDVSGCDMVGLILGRVSKTEWMASVNDGIAFNGEVMVSDTTTIIGSDDVTSDLNQAYTCAKINTVLLDYRANLTSSSQSKLVKVEFENPAMIGSIDSIKLSWYDVRKGEKLNWGNYYSNDNISRVVFQPIMQSEIATPPTISLQLIQTSSSFQLSDFEIVDSENSRTDRATLFFVPTSDEDVADKTKNSTETNLDDGGTSSPTYLGIYDKTNKTNTVSKSQVVKTNDHYDKNLPFLTYCDENTTNEFYCTVTIELPEPINSSRNEDTFMFFVSYPYGEPDTNFAIEFHCGDGGCPGNTSISELSDKTIARIKGVQINVDSTGRANDLYRRVETRLETTDVSFAHLSYVVQLLGENNSSSASIIKNMTVTKQW